MKLFLSIFLLLITQASISQTQQGLSNKEIEEKQYASTLRIIKALEIGDVEKALNYFDAKTNEEDLQKISAEINKIKTVAKLYMVIVYDEGYHIFTCNYNNAAETATLFQLELYYNRTDANSKVVKFVTKDAVTLRKEEEQRTKALNLQSPPPPPPAPIKN